MKYATLDPQKAILRITETEPAISDYTTSEVVSDEQASIVTAGRALRPPTRYFLVVGELKTPDEAREIRRAAYLATLPPVVPKEIANWRARAVLELAGLLPAVEAALAAMPGDEGVVVRHAWDAGAPLVRAGATVTAMAGTLNLTSEQVDAMFIQAAALEI